MSVQEDTAKYLEQAGVTLDGEYAQQVKLQSWRDNLKEVTDLLIKQAALCETFASLEKDASERSEHALANQYKEKRNAAYKDMATNGAAIQVLKKLIEAALPRPSALRTSLRLEEEPKG